MIGRGRASQAALQFALAPVLASPGAVFAVSLLVQGEQGRVGNDLQHLRSSLPGKVRVRI